MKVAIVTSFPDDPGAPVGGVQAVSVNLVRALAKLDDLQVCVLTTSRAYSSSTTESWENVEIRRLAWAGGSMLGNATGPGRRQVRRALEEISPDVVHAHDTYGLMVKGMSIPRVFTIHGFIYGDVLVSGERFALTRSRIWRWIETAGWADQPHIISISPYVRERLSGIAKGVIHDIDNPISEPFFEIARTEHKGTIFCAAAITPRKNTLALVDATAELTSAGVEVELRLAGSLADQGYVHQVRQRIRDLGLEDRVVLLGGLGTAEVIQELSMASVFALVSLEENSPMGIEEAMAAQVPVVTSNRCGMPYMVRDGESGFLVDPHAPADIARRLQQLLADDTLRQNMGVKGKEIALDRFHPTSVARRTRGVYVRAIESFARN